MLVNGYEIKPEQNLRYADLRYADLQGVDLQGADLRYADLRSANLRSADLQGAYLQGANLRSADLRSANLRNVNLQGADLRSADLPPSTVPSHGQFDAWKKSNGRVIRVRILEDTPRVAAVGSRKCRAERVTVISEDVGWNHRHVHDNGSTRYDTGEEVIAHEWCDDVRIECAPGIYFFMTKEEAERF